MSGKLQIADYAKSIEGSQTLAITTKVAELRQSGKTIIDLGAGEPDFKTPQTACQAGIDAINAGFTKYTPNAGLLELREEIAQYLKRQGGFFSSDQILVCSGAKHAIFNALMAVCNPGDEVIIPTPYWTSYPQQVKMAGATSVLLPTKEETEFKITAEQLAAAITPKTKALILNSPANPTGSVYSQNELDALVDVLVASEIFVLSDEIYLELVYDKFVTNSLSVYKELASQLILINGFSKSYAMTGWRIGFMAARQDVVKAAAKLQSHSTSNACSITQHAAIGALRGEDTEARQMREAFAKRRDYMVGRLNNISGINALLPRGAFYMYPNISAYLGKTYKGIVIETPLDLASFFLEEAGVAIVPGEAFGSDSHIRISYANSLENLKSALDKMENALRLL